MTPRLKTAIKRSFPFVLPTVVTLLTFVKQYSSKNAVRRILNTRHPIFLELGAGDTRRDGSWVTIDVDIRKNCDVFWDLRKGLPFPDATITKIYSSHFLEHLSFKEGQQLLSECKRVLVPGGTFSVSVPNARLYIEAYMRSEVPLDKRFFGYVPAYNNTTRIDYVNYTAYLDGQHKYMFDEDNLLHVLKLQGFRNVRLRAFDRSLDLQRRDFESIYAEAQK